MVQRRASLARGGTKVCREVSNCISERASSRRIEQFVLELVAEICANAFDQAIPRFA
jgi:hypothetical protein